MVRPLPDKATHQPRILVEEINVLLEGSRTVAHGVGILAQDKRLVPVSVLCVGFGVAERVVHPAEDVGGLGIPVALVVDQAALVDALDEPVHGRVIAPVAGFVADYPTMSAIILLIGVCREQFGRTMLATAPEIAERGYRQLEFDIRDQRMMLGRLKSRMTICRARSMYASSQSGLSDANARPSPPTTNSPWHSRSLSKQHQSPMALAPAATSVVASSTYHSSKIHNPSSSASS